MKTNTKITPFAGTLIIIASLTSGAMAQTAGLQGFEVSEGYTNNVRVDLLTNSRWTRYNGAAKAVTVAAAGVVNRDGISSTSDQILDLYSAGDFEYAFNSADLGINPSAASNQEVQFSIWFCPDTNGDLAYAKSPFHEMSFLDSSGQTMLSLGTGNEVATNELRVFKSLDGVSYSAASGVTANSHAWNRWDITFDLSDSSPDRVSVDLVRGYGLANGTPQSVDPAVSIYDNVALGTNVDYLSSWRLTSNGSGSKYYYDDVTMDTVPEPATTALLGLGGLALMFRRRK